MWPVSLNVDVSSISYAYILSCYDRGVIWGGWGAVAPQGKRKKEKRKKERKKKKKKEKKKEGNYE